MPFGPTGYSFTLDGLNAAQDTVSAAVALDRITEFSGINETAMMADVTALGDDIKSTTPTAVSDFEPITLKGYVDLDSGGTINASSAFARIGRPARNAAYPARTLLATHTTGVSQAFEVRVESNKLITSQEDDVMFEAVLVSAARARADYVETGF